MIALNIFNTVFPVFIYGLIYLAVILAFIYLIYRIIDRWVTKSIDVRKEQNELLREWINILKNNKN